MKKFLTNFFICLKFLLDYFFLRNFFSPIKNNLAHDNTSIGKIALYLIVPSQNINFSSSFLLSIYFTIIASSKLFHPKRNLISFASEFCYMEFLLEIGVEIFVLYHYRSLPKLNYFFEFH